MKVRVTLSLEVDPAAWRDLYGADDIRADVQRYVANQVAQSAAADAGAIVSTSLR